MSKKLPQKWGWLMPKKKGKPKKMKHEVIDGKIVCPVCKSQRGLACESHTVKDKDGVCYLVSDTLCRKCHVMMKITTPMKDV